MNNIVLPTEKKHYAFNAGSLLDDDQELIHLCARQGCFGITADGIAVLVDPTEDMTGPLFAAWGEIELDRLGLDDMAWVLGAAERLMNMPLGTLGADSVQEAMRAYALGMTAGITHGGGRHEVRFLRHSLN